MKDGKGASFQSGPDHFAPGNLADDHFATNYSMSSLGSIYCDREMIISWSSSWEMNVKLSLISLCDNFNLLLLFSFKNTLLLAQNC